MDYKKTLNLPKTGFPMKANLAGREPKQLEAWETTGLYDRMRPRGDPPLCCMTARPMPTVTSTWARR
jgi:isoleucyl-tRNA synthetase